MAHDDSSAADVNSSSGVVDEALSETRDAPTPVIRWQGETAHAHPDRLAVEEALEIRLAGRPLTVTMRTPGHDDDLVAGLLLTQGLIHQGSDLAPLTHDPASPNRVDVSLSTSLGAAERWRRYTYASSSCGVCGVESLDALDLDADPVVSVLRVKPAMLYALPDRLRDAQESFGLTGGIHAAALFTGAGELLVAREDVGRHNAVDKVVGRALVFEGRALNDVVLLVSGRVSYEIVQKALAARIPMIAAVSAPSSLAVTMAARGGVTLVGFLRGERMNVYSWPERVSL